MRISAYIIIFLVFQLLTFNYNLHYEEARDYGAYASILNGKLPYLDYRWLYGPLGPFLYAFIFKIFGAKFIVLRITAILIGCIAIILSYIIARFVMPEKLAALAGFGAVFCFFGLPAHTYNHFFGTLANLGVTIMIFRFINSSKAYNLFLAGLLLNISFLIHPILLGAEMLLSVLALLALYAFITKIKIAYFLKLIFAFLSGVSLFTIPAYLFILSKVSFMQTFDLVWSHVAWPTGYPVFRFDFSPMYFADTLIDKIRSARFLLIKDLIEPALFYISFFLIPLAAILLVTRGFKDKKERGLFLGISFLVILTLSNISYFLYGYSVILSFFSHGKFYLQYPVILLVFIISRSHAYLRSRTSTFLRNMIMSLFLVFITIFLSFYQFYKLPNAFLRRWFITDISPLRGINLSENEIKRYVEPSKYIKNNSKDGDLLFVCDYDPTYYALTGLSSIFPEDIYTGLVPYDMIIDSSFLPRYADKPMRMEDIIIKRIKDGKPKFIIKHAVKIYIYHTPSGELSKYGIGPNSEKYIADNYFLIKIFPFHQDGEFETMVYKRKGL